MTERWIKIRALEWDWEEGKFVAMPSTWLNASSIDRVQLQPDGKTHILYHSGSAWRGVIVVDAPEHFLPPQPDRFKR